MLSAFFALSVEKLRKVEKMKRKLLFSNQIEIDKIVIMKYFLYQSSLLLTQAMAIREKNLIKNIAWNQHILSLINSIILIKPGCDDHKVANDTKE